MHPVSEREREREREKDYIRQHMHLPESLKKLASSTSDVRSVPREVVAVVLGFTLADRRLNSLIELLACNSNVSSYVIFLAYQYIALYSKAQTHTHKQTKHAHLHICY